MKILATILLAATLTFASVDSLRITHQPPKIDTAFKAKFDSIKGNAFDRDSLKIKPIRVNRDSMFVFVKNDSENQDCPVLDSALFIIGIKALVDVPIPTAWANIVGILFCLTKKNPFVNLDKPTLANVPSTTPPVKLNFIPIGFIWLLPLNVG